MAILLLEDKLGITQNYLPAWTSLCMKAGVSSQEFIRKSVWRSPLANKYSLLMRKGNRLTPGPSQDPTVQMAVRDWVDGLIRDNQVEMIVCMDLALLGLVEPWWDSATIDNMRGGLYNYRGWPFYIMTPISAINTKKSTKDIALMNRGAFSKEDWDDRFGSDGLPNPEHEGEDDDEEREEVYMEPYIVDMGRWIINKDLGKLGRLIKRFRTSGFKEYKPSITVVESIRDAREAEEFLLGAKLISNDIETNPKRGIVTVNGYTGLLDSGEKRTYVFPYYIDKNFQMGTHPNVGEFLRVGTRINASNIPFTFQNGGYDLFWHIFYGMPVANYALDSMSMFWSIWPEMPKRLDFISSIMLDDYRYWKGARKSDDWYTYCIYNGLDCDRTIDDTTGLMDLLMDDERALANFWHAHMRVIIALGMSVKGVKVNESVRLKHKLTLDAAAAKKLAELQFLVADKEFNPNSPQQKSDLLYRKLGIVRRNAKGKFVGPTGKASAGAVALRSMRSEHPIFRIIVNGIMDALSPAKQISNVIGLSRAVWTPENHRYHTGYNGVGTGTTRLSSSKSPIDITGNLQNIRKDYRDIIEADPGFIFLDIDFSAGDDVMVTFESADPQKIDLFRSGKDSHAANATLFFSNWTYEQVVAGKKAKDPRVIDPITGIRQITKKVSHGCNYLMAGNTLLQTAGREAIVAAAKEVGFLDSGTWTNAKLVSFCEQLEGLYRAHYVRFKRNGAGSWYMELREEFIKTGGFTTAFNYFQRFLGDTNDESVLRAIAATAGQANTAGRINMVMEELQFGIIPARFRDAPNPAWGSTGLRINRRKHGINLHMQNHDSLTWGILLSHANWQEGVDRIFRVMERPVRIRNKLTGQLEEFVVGRETEIGLRWGNELHGLKVNSVEAVEQGIKDFGLN